MVDSWDGWRHFAPDDAQQAVAARVWRFERRDPGSYLRGNYEMNRNANITKKKTDKKPDDELNGNINGPLRNGRGQ